MKDSIKREQNQAGLSFAERKNFRPKVKRNRLLLLLALLLTAATGAWGMQIYISYPSWPTGTNVNGEGNLVLEMEASDSFENMKAKIEDKSGLNPDYMKLYFNSVEMANDETLKAKGVTSNSVLTLVYTLYNVTMKDGVKDVDKWTVKVGEGQAQALPVGGLSKGDAVTLKYTGRLKVKSVKATSDAAAPSVPDGALSGVFSVSDTKKVYFSKGNLQATYNTSWSWAFATNQWDYIGNAAGNTSINGGGTISGTGTVDLFGWVGAACAWTGAAQYGISNVTQAAQYGNVEGEALKSDWGTLAITNGGNTANFGWHSLASGEWEYLFKTRTAPSGVRYAHATVNSVPGLVLLPDDWSTDYYSLNKVNDATGTAYTDNDISSTDWTSKLEAHGAVFLPAGGYRGGTDGATVSDAGVQGTYWSSTSSANQSAGCFFFRSAVFWGNTSNFARNRGCSVRLVREVATSDAAPAEATYTLLSAATTEDVGKVVCAAGHLHDAKTAVPTGCTAVGILGKVTETGQGLILALQNASAQNWNTVNGWASVTAYAGTTLKVLPNDAARGTNLTSYTTLGETTVSNWAVAKKSDYEAIFTNLGSTTSDSDGTTYDDNVNAFITTGVGGTAISGENWSATEFPDEDNYAWLFGSEFWVADSEAYSYSVRPVLGFGGEAVAPATGNIVDLSTLTADYEAQNGDVLTGTLYGPTQPYKITIADGATVTLDNATIKGKKDSNYDWAGLNCLGTATIVLKDGTTNTVRGFYENYPGILVPTGSKLTIKGGTEGTGKLTASPFDGGTEESYGAGIGGGYDIPCGDIDIQGGVITATGGCYAAGIGGGTEAGSDASCGNITITGGDITATGGQAAAGIGSGYDNTCGNITIASTVKKVTATKGEYAPHSIGKGDDGSCGTVTIGGTVYWQDNAAVNGGDTYLGQATIIYSEP